MPRCKLCKEKTTQRFGLTFACSIDHALQIGKRRAEKLKRKAEREEKRRHREQKEKVRPLKWYADRAREACHEYIRERDKDMPCISCGRHHGGQNHAGHYRSAGSNSELRYSESNIHKQCAPCNSHLSGNLTNYRIGLVAKIGEEAVLALEENRQVRKWSKEELIEIRSYYKQKLREIKAESV